MSGWILVLTLLAPRGVAVAVDPHPYPSLGACEAVGEQWAAERGAAAWRYECLEREDER